ncbi:IclR family transcriptional regulator [Citricoccus zhacaiensis]|uniref:IclR family transcriptional regulator n=1 Tax=Citricoccus zhacaiensis TaxID=489142 RepID=A0ABQ2MA18_9MICC|nr:IclR family transcriptional regulator [Citricoccus zhacaiensis]GGO48666.1 IclR family transcriptional regulator [Citricoccus zhacaiensis]
MSDLDGVAKDSGDADRPSILAKAFDILGTFNGQHRVLTLTEISRKSGWPKSTVHRLLQRLSELEVIEQHGSGYRLGIRLMQMTSAMPVDGMREMALPHMAQLQAWSNAPVHFGVLRGKDVVVIQTLHAADTTSPIGEPGARIPSHLSAAGRAMLAFLPEEEIDEILAPPLIAMTPTSITDPQEIREQLAAVRSSKSAVQFGEIHAGIGNVASPILIKGRPMGAVAVQFDASKPLSDAITQGVMLTAKRITLDTIALVRKRQELFPYEF